MTDGCTCCAGELATPVMVTNRPGLDAIAYRVGTHPQFLESMLARLGDELVPGGRPLAALTTRAPDDPALAVLDGCAALADVLTFYQERIANEGYLRCATEDRSVRELGRLVGYEPRPGVAATAFLSYTIDAGARVTVPAGSRVQSVPAPGELPQTFETAEALEGRGEWNTLEVRRTHGRHHEVLAAAADALGPVQVFLTGITTGLTAGDALLVDTGVSQNLFRVVDVTPDPSARRTRVLVQRWRPPARPSAPDEPQVPDGEDVEDLLDRHRDPSVFGVAASGTNARRITERLDEFRTDVALALQGAELHDRLRDQLLPELRGLAPSRPGPLSRWINGLVTELETIVARIDADPGAAAPGRAPAPPATPSPPGATTIGNALTSLATRPSTPPAGPQALDRDATRDFAAGSDAVPGLLAALRPDLRPALYQAWSAAPVTPTSPVRCSALRLRVPLFGSSARPEPPVNGQGVLTDTREWTATESPTTVSLEGTHPTLTAGGWVVVDRPAADPFVEPVVARIVSVRELSRTDYGITARTTLLDLDRPWLDADVEDTEDFAVVRGTTVLTRADEVELTEAPLDPFDHAVGGDEIDLAELYDGLAPGRWIVVSGERTDVRARPVGGSPPGVGPNVPIAGVLGTELTMIAGVRQGFDPAEPGARTRTTLVLATPLAYSYRRDTVQILGNVVKASHGETTTEVLGSGDGSRSHQTFSLTRRPLTHVSAPTDSGVSSTLVVAVDGVRWSEADDLLDLPPTAHRFVARSADDGATSVTFGDGTEGARLPTGNANVTAAYRFGLGEIGNLPADRLTLLTTRPQGVMAVRNPMRASGGADRESGNESRRRIPLGVTALDRVVSVADYADFAMGFAGVGKAAVELLSVQRSRIVHLTVSGSGDAPLDPASDVLMNLRRALARSGDPYQPFQIDVRRLLALVVDARVAIEPDRRWDLVEPEIRATLLARFGFDRRDLAQDVTRGEVVAAVQAVPGVRFVDLDLLDALDEESVRAALTDPGAPGFGGDLRLRHRVVARGARLAGTPPDVVPAELAVLLPDAAASTLRLTEIRS